MARTKKAKSRKRATKRPVKDLPTKGTKAVKGGSSYASRPYDLDPFKTIKL
jgi:hypothetical protein